VERDFARLAAGRAGCQHLVHQGQNRNRSRPEPKVRIQLSPAASHSKQCGQPRRLQRTSCLGQFSDRQPSGRRVPCSRCRSRSLAAWRSAANMPGRLEGAGDA
jgi:hypothetical protein